MTELNRAAQALRESEEQLRAFFNSAVVGVAVLTPEARFVQANPAFCSIVGYSLDELCAIDCVTLTHPDDCAQMQTLIHQLVAGEIPSFVLEKRYFRKDDSSLSLPATAESRWRSDQVAAGVGPWAT